MLTVGIEDLFGPLLSSKNISCESGAKPKREKESQEEQGRYSFGRTVLAQTSIVTRKENGGEFLRGPSASSVRLLRT